MEIDNKDIFDILDNLEFEEPRTTGQGGQLYESRWSGGQRFIERTLCDHEFTQFNTSQDAHYFGVWVNPKLFCLVTYLEGDINVVQCENKEQYNVEIQSCIDFYEESANSQDRTEFLIK